MRKSVGAPNGQSSDYRLRPTLRMVDNAATGTLTGVVDAVLATAADCIPVVYVYEGDVIPSDIDGDDADPDPITSAMVETSDGGATWSYEVGFLAASPAYRAAFTCDDDDTQLDETLVFFPETGADFSLAADEVAVIDFVSGP